MQHVEFEHGLAIGGGYLLLPRYGQKGDQSSKAQTWVDE